MIELFQPPPAWGLPSLSPFCVKLETFLRMAGLPYQVRPGNPVQAPKGKIPYIRDDDGRLMGDSGLIIAHLTQKHGVRLDAHLDASQLATGHALRRMTEEHLYFAIAYLRWSGEESWPHVRTYFRAIMPPLIGGAILSVVRRRLLASMRGQGIARHTREEVQRAAQADIAALAQALGDQPYFLGMEPTSLDAAVYGMLVHILWIPWDAPEKRFAASRANLVAYCERMRARYWT